MYTILVQNDNSLHTSVKERIMQRSKMVDTLHFLVEPMYKEEHDMSTFNATLKYKLPISNEPCSENLVLSDELYKDHLEYKLPFDTNLTKEAGEIEVMITFTKVDLDEEGNGLQYVRTTSTTTITIVPIAAWTNITTDSALNAVDQRLLEVDAMIKALSETGDLYSSTKADNLVLDDETQEIYLTANGEQIGDRVKLSDLGDNIVDSSTEGLVTMMI